MYRACVFGRFLPSKFPLRKSNLRFKQLFGSSRPMERDLRQRLLTVAEDLFARRGYTETRVREITSRAGCNLAAVNYHFGGKRNLYLAVIEERWVPRALRIREEFVRNLHRSPSGPEGVVEALFRAFFQSPFTERESWRHRRLLAQELAQPTEALEIMLSRGLRPLLETIRESLQDRLPPGVPERRVRLTVFSLLGQTLYFHLARPMIQNFLGEFPPEEELLRHVKDFALRGLKGLTG